MSAPRRLRTRLDSPTGVGGGAETGTGTKRSANDSSSRRQSPSSSAQTFGPSVAQGGQYSRDTWTTPMDIALLQVLCKVPRPIGLHRHLRMVNVHRAFMKQCERLSLPNVTLTIKDIRNRLSDWYMLNDAAEIAPLDSAEDLTAGEGKRMKEAGPPSLGAGRLPEITDTSSRRDILGFLNAWIFDAPRPYWLPPNEYGGLMQKLEADQSADRNAENRPVGGGHAQVQDTDSLGKEASHTPKTKTSHKPRPRAPSSTRVRSQTLGLAARRFQASTSSDEESPVDGSEEGAEDETEKDQEDMDGQTRDEDKTARKPCVRSTRSTRSTLKRLVPETPSVSRKPKRVRK